jgi:protein-S-isoprenylcysteine O-methyltransferase Ste14
MDVAASWAFLILFTLMGIGASAWLLPRDPALLNSRLHVMQKGQSIWDRIWISFFITIWCVWFVFMGLDAQRWHWSSLPLWVNVLGGVLFALGFLAILRVFRENSYAAPAVRLQEDRGQHVIDTGPYAIVRHPMYAASIVYLFGIPLLLGSAYGLLVPPIFIIGVAGRAVFEENMLARELTGYADYMKRVRYRLIPLVW